MRRGLVALAASALLVLAACNGGGGDSDHHHHDEVPCPSGQILVVEHSSTAGEVEQCMPMDTGPAPSLPVVPGPGQ